MLNIRPVDVPAGKLDIGLYRFLRVAGIPDDETPYHVHLIAVQNLDSLERGIPRFAALFTPQVFGAGTQEIQIGFENV
jgi:hypothetical protein